MDRRDSLKSIVLGAAGGAAILSGCKPVTSEQLEEIGMATAEYLSTRTPEERAIIKKLIDETYLNNHELSTVSKLCDIIIPADEQGPAASSANVAGFIEFIIKDQPRFQIPMRGGLMWLDNTARDGFEKTFVELTDSEQKTIIDKIAYPDKVAEGMEYGAKFFDIIKNLTVTGYYTSQQGLKSLGYVGNVPNVWDGVPAEVLADHDVDYDPEWLAKCVNQENREVMAEWDDQGNLIT